MVIGRSEDGQGLEKKLAKMETLLDGLHDNDFAIAGTDGRHLEKQSETVLIGLAWIVQLERQNELLFHMMQKHEDKIDELIQVGQTNENRNTVLEHRTKSSWR